MAIGMLWTAMVVFAMVLCKVAGDEDRYMEELYRLEERWAKEDSRDV